MHIPQSHLYNYIDSIVDSSVIIYRWSPPGSRNLADLSELKNHCTDWATWSNYYIAIMHDQEPLCFNLYNDTYLKNNLEKWYRDTLPDWEIFSTILDNPVLAPEIYSKNLSALRYGLHLYDKNILVHSELNSEEVKKYQEIGFETVYWWSHAVIARDWYRYAEHDPRLVECPDTFPKDFNVYNRAWSGWREYRLYFADQIITKDLVKSCNVYFSPIDNDEHYLDHKWNQPNFCPVNDLRVLPRPRVDSHASADYNIDDYTQCWFDVVLETLFDGPTVHLTEKILRPIACGKPFLLAAGPGSLQLLRDYGFQTFGDFIDESYDDETDSVKRLDAIISTMKKIQNFTPQQRMLVNRRLKKVCEHNRNHFFSKEFFNHVISEFKTNFVKAQLECDKNKKGQRWLHLRKLAKSALSDDSRIINDANTDPVIIDQLLKLFNNG
jgi:hypothetical protein